MVVFTETQITDYIERIIHQRIDYIKNPLNYPMGDIIIVFMEKWVRIFQRNNSSYSSIFYTLYNFINGLGNNLKSDNYASIKNTLILMLIF